MSSQARDQGEQPGDTFVGWGVTAGSAGTAQVSVQSIKGVGGVDNPGGRLQRTLTWDDSLPVPSFLPEFAVARAVSRQIESV